MKNEKPYWQSVTFWGAVVAIISTLAQAFQYDIGNTKAWAAAIVGIIGGVVAIYGRFTAITKIKKIKGDNSMKTLLMLFAIMLVMPGCALFRKAKPALVTTAGKVTQKLSMKYLECKTGEAVRADVEDWAARLLKSKSQDESESLSGASLGSQLCSKSVEFALKLGGDWGDGRLPQSWQDDGCNLDSPVETLTEFADKLCGRIGSGTGYIRYGPPELSYI